MWETAKRGLRAVADILLPRVCIVCGKKLTFDETHLCSHCLSDLPQTRFWFMSHNPMADRFNAAIQKRLEHKMSEGISTYERYAFATALFFYDSEAGYRHISYQIKYHGNTAAGHHFGRMLGTKVAEAPWFADVDAVLPVPLHWKRKWSRGYNQSEIIASEVAAAINAPMLTDMLKRRRHTTTQTKLGIEGKETNVKGAFVTCRTQQLNHILLIDDIFTSGNTLAECFMALRAIFPPSVRISVATLGFVGG